MMRTSSRIVIVLSVFVSMLTAAACSSNAPKTVSNSPASSSPPSPAATKKDGPPPKIVYLSPSTVYDRKTPEEQQIHDLIQQKTGVDVEVSFVPGDQIDNKRNLMLSAGEQLDVFKVTLAQAIDLYKNGAIIPLDDLINQYGPNLKKNIPAQAWAEATSDGKILGIPSMSPINLGAVLQIRSDWLKNVNLPMPATIEELEKTMDAFLSQDPDKNGKKDTFPLSTAGNTFINLENAFAPFFLPQGMAWWKDQNGKIMPPELHPGYKDMMDKLIEWNKKGYIWPDMLLSKTDKQKELIAQNKVGIAAGNYSSTITQALEVLIKSVPEANYEPFALQGKGINKYPTLAPATQFAVVAKKSKNPEAVVKFLDYTATKEGNLTVLYGREGKDYTKLPNGTFEFNAEDKTDYTKANYYARYFVIQMVLDDLPMFPFNTWSDQKYTEMQRKVNKLPNFDPLDRGVFFDQAQWKSQPKLKDIDTYMTEQKTKVFTGDVPLANWDKLMDEWRKMGGNQMIEDRNAQFAQAKK
ncbi:MAG: extracellular solute-binding protein [Paenibacillaceae bacterium]|nr:extracellular solute-binding protein [Paenibacillaceae bacterium]